MFQVVFALVIIVIVVATGYAALLVPRWALPLCIVGAFVALFASVPLIGVIVDSANARAIRSYMESLGATDVVVRPHPNHYGVKFRVGSRNHYAKCLVMKRGQFKWKGRPPDQLIRGSGAA